MECFVMAAISGLAVLLACSSASGGTGDKTGYQESGLRIECRPDPLLFRESPDMAKMEKAFGEAGVQARWVSVVSPNGSPVFASEFIPSDLDRLDERGKALKEWVDCIHRQGMAAVSWYPLILSKSGVTLRPEWTQVPIVPHPPGMHRESNCCFNTGYGDALIEFCSEAIDKFGLDGIWFDGSSWTQIWDRPIGLTCACPACKALFKKQTGLCIPDRIDWADATFRRWVAWRFDAFGGYIGKLASAIRKRHPGAAVVLNHYHRPGIPWHSGIPLNPYEADIITGSEAAGEPGADLVSRLCRAYGRNQSEVWMTFKFGSKPDTNPKTDEDIHHALTCITAGAMPSYGTEPEAKDLPETAGYVARFVNSLKPYVCRESLKYAAMHVSQQTETFWFGRSPRGLDWAPEPYWQCMLGWTQALMQAHVPPDVVYDKQMTDDHLKSYRLLFMPLSFALSDQQCEAVVRFAERGGTVILGPAAGELDEWGEKRLENTLGRSLGFGFARVPEPSGRGAIAVNTGQPWGGVIVTPYYSVPNLTGSGWEISLSGEYAGQGGPVIARKKVGRGAVVLLGADLGGTASWATPVTGGDTSIAVTDETAFSGNRSLKFVDGPAAPQEFCPDLEIKYAPVRPPEAAQMVFSCAMRADEDSAPHIEMRAWPDHIGPSLRIDATGTLCAQQKKLCKIPRGMWFRLVITARLVGDRTFDVSVVLPNTAPKTFAGLPYPSASFEGSDWMVIYGGGSGKGTFFVDDFELSCSGGELGARASAVIVDDFENTPVGATTPQSALRGLMRQIVDASEQPVRLDGPPEVRMGVFQRGEGEIVVHLHNTVGSRVSRASGGVVTVTAPTSVHSAVLALSGKALPVKRGDREVMVEVPPVAMHEVILLK